uniref:Uncharacterized protein n=1 Tax=Arundo donax TaxID=35708 RepID=A0A0A9AAX8_ARUDO
MNYTQCELTFSKQ